MTPADVLPHFGIDAANLEARPLPGGHIHDTWFVRCDGGAWVLQRLNHDVFPDLDGVARNVEAVSAALAAARGAGRYPLEVVLPRHVREGAVWRAAPFVEGSYAVERVDDVPRARAAGEAFGRFAAALADFPADELTVVLPGFHDLGRRLEALAAAVKVDAHGRLSAAEREVERCRAGARLAARLASLESSLPRRVAHNDAKVANLLFDRGDHRVRAILDLDTCMPGFRMHDFGDLVRSTVAAAPEDSTALDDAGVREEIFAALARGYLAPLAGAIDAAERESLWYGAVALPLLVGTRFLTDHLEGDRYFKIERPGHNLDRARNQLALYDDLLRRENALRPLLSE